MGEIKSTLDLVMERTRHLTLSSEEKSAQDARDQRRRIQGFIQKYRDQTLTLSELEGQLARDCPTELHAKGGMLHRELLRQIDLNQDNEAVLFLLKSLCKVDPAPIADLFAEYDENISAAGERQASRHLATLAAERGIGGKALIPNLQSDPEWRKIREDIEQRYGERLARAKMI